MKRPSSSPSPIPAPSHSTTLRMCSITLVGMFLPRRRFGPPSISYLPRDAGLIHDFPRSRQGQRWRALLVVGSLRGQGIVPAEPTSWRSDRGVRDAAPELVTGRNRLYSGATGFKTG